VEDGGCEGVLEEEGEEDCEGEEEDGAFAACGVWRAGAEACVAEGGCCVAAAVG